MPAFNRVVVIVLDGAGCGALPDAAAYGDEGSDTLGHVALEVGLRVPNLRALGLGQLVPLGGSTPAPDGAWGRMTERSPGKDSVTGHWEMAGVVLDAPFPTFPNGFPDEVIREFEHRIDRRTMGNVVASGTEILDRLGTEHVRTGCPIVYTSADSVFQLAAHERVVPVPELYRMCETAFELVARGLGVARVIARPFIGEAGSFTRTANRHDFTLAPPRSTLLDALSSREISVTGVGKIRDLFGGRGLRQSFSTSNDQEGMDRVLELMRGGEAGLIVANLVDFDTLYGHRNDALGYATNLERFDHRLGELRAELQASDLLVVTADHGNDPTTVSTDHSREYVPVLLTGPGVRRGVNLGTRETFADLGQTLAANFGVGPLASGSSFLESIVADHP